MAASSASKVPDPQRRCKLLSLPAEIRTNIWEVVFTVPPDEDGLVQVSNPEISKWRRLRLRSRTPSQAREGDQAKSVLQLLESCRLIHEEAAGIFYHQKNRIKVSIYSFFECFDFLDALGERRRHALRDLTIHAMELSQVTTICELGYLAHLSRLETVLFEVVSLGLTGKISEFRARQVVDFLAGLRNLHGVKKVTLKVNQPRGKETPVVSELSAAIPKHLANSVERESEAEEQ